jgi:hypothetical protein
MQTLYKCDKFDKEKCAKVEHCVCKYTFDPRHIWPGSEIIKRWTENKTPIEIETEGCNNGKDRSSCYISFYKEVDI